MSTLSSATKAFVGEAPPRSLRQNAAEDTPSVTRLFLVLVSLATLIPFILVPLTASYKPSTQGMMSLFIIMNLLGGTTHVATTYFYYYDQDWRRFFKLNPGRYLVAPCFIITVSSLLFAFGSVPLKTYGFLFYFVWQTYHYQRQNYGLLQFTAKATKTHRAFWQERSALELSAFAGIIAMIRIYRLADQTIFEPWILTLFELARNTLFGGVTLLVVWSLALILKSGSLSLPRVLALLSGAYFFLPSFIFEDPKSAITSYALAHGFQYMVFMFFIGFRDAHEERSEAHLKWRLASLAVISLGLGLIMYVMSDRSFWGRFAEPIFGAYLGITMSHFVIDAGVWKLSRKFQSSYMAGAFPFLKSSKA